MHPTSSKEALFDFCTRFAADRISRIQQAINDLQESLNAETKSSAGDKHETGRAMVQLEREKLGKQLAEAEKMRHILTKVPLGKTSGGIGLGSWVKTSKNNYFLAISAGEFKTSDGITYCISSATPIGRLLLGKLEGDEIAFNGTSIKILEIQ